MIWDTIAETIKAEYDSGMTLTEIGKKHNVAHSVIQRLLSKKRSAEKSTLQTVQRMFPNATLHLNGSNVDISTIRNLEATLANIRKIINDDTFTPEKKMKLIQIILE